MKTGILFDLDGTLLNTLEDLLDATNYALAQCGYPARTPTQMTKIACRRKWGGYCAFISPITPPIVR